MDECINHVKVYQFADELKNMLEKNIEENFQELKFILQEQLCESNLFDNSKQLQAFENVLVLIEDLKELLSKINIEDGEIADNEVQELVGYIENTKYISEDTKQEFKEFVVDNPDVHMKPCSIAPISFNTFRSTPIYSTTNVSRTIQPDQLTKTNLDTSKIGFIGQPERDTFIKKVDINSINDIASKRPDLYSYIRNIQSYAQRISNASSTGEMLSLIRSISYEKDKLSRELNA